MACLYHSSTLVTSLYNQRAMYDNNKSQGSDLLLPLMLVGGAALGFALLKKGVGPKVVKPMVMKNYIDRMQVTDAGFDLDIKHKKAWLHFTINNPNNRPLNIQAIVGHVTIFENDPKKPGFRLGDIDNFSPILIAPLSAKKINLTISIKAINALAYLAKVLTGKWQGQNINFQGTITANGTMWPINEFIKISG